MAHTRTAAVIPSDDDALARARRVDVVLQQIESLPTLSPIATRLMALSSRDDEQFDEIIRLMEMDPALTGRMLALCRRASTGVSQPVTTVRRAAVLLGLEAVQSAVLSVQVYDLLARPTGIDEPAARRAGAGLDRDGFWRHSLAVACCAEMLATEHRELKVRPDEAFTAGLMHDLGKVVLDWILPQSYAKVLELAEAKRSDLATMERAVIGLDHHVAGKRLAEHWGLPHVLQDVMWLHGQPARSLPDLPHRALVALVTAADTIVRLMHLGWSGEFGDPPGESIACQEAMLDPKRLARVQSKLHEALAKRCADLGVGTPTPPELMMQSLATANGRLARLNSTLQSRTTAARYQSRVLESLGTFAAAARPGSSINDVLGQVASGFNQLAGPGFTAMLFQSRDGDAWRLSRHQPDGTVVSSDSIEPPRGTDGRPQNLASLARGGELGAWAGLLAWLGQHLVTKAAMPDLRRLRVLTLVSGLGPTAAIIHDRDDAEILAPAGARPLAVLSGAWAWAVAAATQHQGARRLSEELALTARTLTETQGRLAEAESMARLGELTAGAAHEMNNPLTVISGRGQLLAAKLTDPLLKQQADDITGAAGKLTDLITSLHILARPPLIKREPCAIADVFPDAVRRAKADANVAAALTVPGVRCSAAERIALLTVDREMFTRALSELIKNALESGHAATSPIDVRAALDPLDDALVITVRDHGAGMSEHAGKHAFDPFFSEKPAGRQTGLGLSIARRLMELHGAQIRLSAAPSGPGVVASIRLALWRHDATSAAA